MWWPKRFRPPRDDGLVISYRIAEACRVSLHAVGAHPDVPEEVRGWVNHWLAGYNTHVAMWLQNTYGPEVFAMADRITNEVLEASRHPERDLFDKWESQFREE